MKPRNNRRKLGYGGIVLVILIAIISLSVHAQFVNAPAVIQSLDQKLSSVFKIYEIQGYTTDEKGSQIAIFNPQYEGVRAAIDFFAIFGILSLVFLSNDAIKKMLTKKGCTILAFVLALAFLMGSKALVGRLIVFWPYMLFIGAAVLLYYGCLGMFGGEQAGAGTKVICLLVSFALAFVIYSFLFVGSFDLNLPQWAGGGFKSVDSAPGSRLIQDPISVQTENEKSKIAEIEKLLENSKTAIGEARQLITGKNIDGAKLKITAAKTFLASAKTAAQQLKDGSDKTKLLQKITALENDIKAVEATLTPTIVEVGVTVYRCLNNKVSSKQIAYGRTIPGYYATEAEAKKNCKTIVVPPPGGSDPKVPSPDSMITKLSNAGPDDVKKICAEIANYVDAPEYKAAKKAYKDAYNIFCEGYKKWQ